MDIQNDTRKQGAIDGLRSDWAGGGDSVRQIKGYALEDVVDDEPEYFIWLNKQYPDLFDLDAVELIELANQGR